MERERVFSEKSKPSLLELHFKVKMQHKRLWTGLPVGDSIQLSLMSKILYYS